MRTRQLAESLSPTMVEDRRYFHAHPELSTHEVETTRAIGERLASLGIETLMFSRLPGCLGVLRGKSTGKTVLLRADIDALPVLEKTGLPFASHYSGVMHACGHDAHIAMLLGAARILSAQRTEFSGEVRFLFQSAEEDALGAQAAVDEGVIDRVDAALALHVWPLLPSGMFSLEAGKRMASCDDFTIEICGKSAHCATPQLGFDAILAASSVAQALQSLVSRRFTPLEPLIVHIGSIHGGSRSNIVCDKVLMEGTVRTYNNELRMQIEPVLRATATRAAEAFGCEALVSYAYQIGPVVNRDEAMLSVARTAVQRLYGQESLGITPAQATAEDFSVISERVPSVYGFLGTASDAVAGSRVNNHNECFTVDETALPRGAALMAQFALDVLSTR